MLNSTTVHANNNAPLRGLINAPASSSHGFADPKQMTLALAEFLARGAARWSGPALYSRPLAVNIGGRKSEEKGKKKKSKGGDSHCEV